MGVQWYGWTWNARPHSSSSTANSGWFSAPSRSLMTTVRSASTSFGSKAALRIRSDSIIRAVSIELAAPFEHHVLDPVGRARHAGYLVPGADPIYDPSGQGLRVRDRAKDHLQAVLQGLHMGGHPFGRNAGARYRVARPLLRLKTNVLHWLPV